MALWRMVRDGASRLLTMRLRAIAIVLVQSFRNTIDAIQPVISAMNAVASP
jgi:hypothetical protein